MKKSIKERKAKVRPNLTANQIQVLNWLLKDRLTVDQIKQIKGLNRPNAIYNTISILRKKGYLTKSLKIESSLIKQLPKDKHLRLHAEGFTIKILYKNNNYTKLLKSKNKDIREGNTIELYKDKLVVYSNKDFFGSTVDECFKLSSLYWDRFLRVLENDYNIILVKARNTKIYRFRQHIADLRNPISKYIIKQNQHFKVYDDEGNIRLIVDHSFIAEFEAVNNKYCKQDVERLESFHKDIILKPESFNISELSMLCRDNTININRMSQDLIELNKTLGNTVKILEQTITIQNNQIQLLTSKRDNKQDNHIYGNYLM